MRSTASELTAGGKQLRARDHAGRGVQRTAERLSVADGDLSARTPLEHDHRQPGFLLEFLITESSGVVKRARVHLPEHASARMGGKLIELSSVREVMT